MTQALARGIPIVPTPFDVAGRLDDEGITTLVAFEVHHGVPGLNVLGLMGEAHRLAEGPARCPGHGRRFRPPARASTTSPSPEPDAILVRLGLADRGRVDPGCGHLRRA